MQPINEISEQKPRVMTDEQRRYLQNQTLELKPALLIFAAIMVTFALILVVMGILRSIDLIGWLIVLGIIAFMTWGLSLIISIYWRMERDLREMVLDCVEGIIRLSITKQNSSSNQEFHEIIIGNAKFRIPQETYLQFKDGHSYRIYFARHSKIFMYAEFDSTIGLGVQTIHRTDLPQAKAKSSSQLENLNIVDEYAIKLKRDMADDYRAVIFQRFRRDTLTVLALLALFGLPLICLAVFFVTPYEHPKDWFSFGFLSIPAVCIISLLIYDYLQLYRDLRAGALQSFDGNIRIEGGVMTNYLHVVAVEDNETKVFNVTREMMEGLVERQVYRVYYTPHSKIFVYAEKL